MCPVFANARAKSINVALGANLRECRQIAPALEHQGMGERSIDGKIKMCALEGWAQMTTRGFAVAIPHLFVGMLDNPW